MSRGDGLDAKTREPLDDNEQPAAARKLTLTILHHASPSRVGERSFTDGTALELSRRTPEFGSIPRALLDPFISRNACSIAVEGAQLRFRRPSGASVLEVNGANVESELSIPSRQLEAGVVLNVGRRAVLLLHWSSDQMGAGGVGSASASGGLRGSDPEMGLIGESAAMFRVRREIKKLAPLSIPVLIRGATGTGKELVAQAIHQLSARNKAPFVAVNVATLAPSVAASELFGHKKGAFTGAIADHPGHFGRADGGTLFLDEIAEASLEIQAFLLRTLETSIVQPVGGAGDRKVDVRLLTATDADLESLAARGAFREPLLHRLSGFVVRLPRLAERREDLGRLLVHFMTVEARGLGVALDTGDEDRPWLPADVVARLALYEWPGNVRQLRNIARQLLVAREEGPAAVVEVVESLSRPMEENALPVVVRSAVVSSAVVTRKPADVRDEEILAALEKNGWKLERAATELGISRTSLYRRIEKIPELTKSKDLPAEVIESAIERAGGDFAAAARALKISEAGLRLRVGELQKTKR